VVEIAFDREVTCGRAPVARHAQRVEHRPVPARVFPAGNCRAMAAARRIGATATHQITGEAVTHTDAQDLTRRYVAVWNEPDAALRRKAIQELWTEDGAHILQPPAEVRQAAAGLGFASAALEARGHDELEIRVTRAYQDFVAPGEFTFRPRDNADGLATWSSSTGRWSLPTAARRRPSAWRSSSSGRTAGSRPTTSSSKADISTA